MLTPAPRSRPDRLIRVLLIAASAAAPTACASGAATPAASPGLTASGSVESSASAANLPSSSAAAATPSVSTGPAASSGPFRLTSPAFADGEAIPRKYTCDGEDVSPPLAWHGVPSGAGALVLVVDDPDARDFVHWVVIDLPPAGDGSLAEGASTAANLPRQGRTSFGQARWGGPCPPSGTHHYRFRLIAIRQPLGLTGTPTAADVLGAANPQTVAEATLGGTYRRS